jgi:hypothetical protein
MHVSSPRPRNWDQGLAPPNVVRSEQRRLDEIGADDTILGELLAYWRSLSRRGAVPPEHRSFDLAQAQRAAGRAHVIDCTPDDPSRFVVRVYAAQCMETGLFAGRDLSGLPLSDIPCPLFRQGVATDYNSVKASAAPSFHHIVTRLYWRPSSYTRLILPCANEAGKLTQLLVVINQRPLPHLSTLPAAPVDSLDPEAVGTSALEIRAQVEAQLAGWGADGHETMALALALGNLGLSALGERYGRSAVLNFIQGMAESELVERTGHDSRSRKPRPH